MQRSALCRSRRELSNEYLLAKIGVDTAENEPCQVCPLSAYGYPRFVLDGTKELFAHYDFSSGDHADLDQVVRIATGKA